MELVENEGEGCGCGDCEADLAVGSTRDDDVVVGVRHGACLEHVIAMSRMVAEEGNPFAPIPDLDRAVVAAGDESRAIGSEGNRVHTPVVAFQMVVDPEPANEILAGKRMRESG